VLRNHAPHGGWPAFARYGEGRTIARTLDRAGYRTAYVGKYLNQYRRADGAVPPGWDHWFVFDEDNGAYLDYRVVTWSEGDTRSRRIRFGNRARDYSTDVFANEAVRTIRRTDATDPLFLVVSPFAPHTPSIPAPRDRGSRASAPVRFGPAFNEDDLSDKPAWVRRLHRADPGEVAQRIRRQWETLASVDRLVGRVVDALRATDRLRDTILVFTSDNGLNTGEHRWQGKLAAYEGSIRVPFAIRYDRGRWRNGSSTALASTLDLAPTIADATGVRLTSEGRSMLPFLERRRDTVRRWVRLEHLGPPPPRGGPPTYCGIRTRTLTYVHYTTGEEEFYDLRRDPAQLRSRTSGASYERIRRLAKRHCRSTGLW
jgi:arylsulfatase A-like enzyme